MIIQARVMVRIPVIPAIQSSAKRLLAAFGDLTLWHSACVCVVIVYLSTYPRLSARMLVGHVPLHGPRALAALRRRPLASRPQLPLSLSACYPLPLCGVSTPV